MKAMGKMRLQSNQGSTCLVSVLHGYCGSIDQLKMVVEVVQDARPEADILLPKLPTSRLSFADPHDILRGILALMDEQWLKDPVVDAENRAPGASR